MIKRSLRRYWHILAAATAASWVMAAGAASAHDAGHSRGHKEGPVAVIVSVIGVIAVVVFIVGLGSLSVRRRTRNGPPTRNPTQGGPPGSGRGPFDHWFRTRE